MKAAVKAEVPDYEMLATLSTFLSDLHANQLGDAVVKRVAKFFKVSPVS